MSTNNDGIACFTSSISAVRAQAFMMKSSSIATEYVNPIALPKSNEFKVGIIIRDLGNHGRETLLTEPPDFPKLSPTFSSDWILPYVDHPVFRNFDFLNMKAVPYLESPRNRPHELCTTCYIQAGRTDSLQAIAFLVHRDDDTNASAMEDLVTVHIRTPLLPLSYGPFTMLPTQQLRRFYAVQHAMVRLAQKTNTMALIAGPLRTGLLPVDAYANALYYDQRSSSQSLLASDWNFNSLTCSYSIPRGEKTAGTHVIPALLKALYFLLPALDADQDIYYDILQSNKYAYVFRLRNLAGWKIIGSVNTVITDFVAMNSTFDKFISDNTTHQIISPHIMTLYPLSHNNTLYPFVQASQDNAKQALLAAIPGLAADVQTRFQNDTFKHKDVLLLDPQQWQHLITCTGLHMLKKYLDLYASKANLTQQLAVSDYLLRSLLHDYAPSSSPSHPFSTADLSSCLLTYFSFCSGIAMELLNDSSSPLTAGELRGELVGKADTVSISVPQVLSMLSVCRGVAADKWCTKFVMATESPFATVKDLAIFIFNQGENANFFTTTYTLLYPYDLIRLPAKEFKTLFLNAHNYHAVIKNAQADNAALNARSAPDVVQNGLAYALFIANPKKLP